VLDVNVEVPHAFETVTVGVAGTAIGADVPTPAVLVQPLLVMVTE
jgi:hypothetical protein